MPGHRLRRSARSIPDYPLGREQGIRPRTIRLSPQALGRPGRCGPQYYRTDSGTLLARLLSVGMSKQPGLNVPVDRRSRQGRSEAGRPVPGMLMTSVCESFSSSLHLTYKKASRPAGDGAGLVGLDPRANERPSIRFRRSAGFRPDAPIRSSVLIAGHQAKR